MLYSLQEGRFSTFLLFFYQKGYNMTTGKMWKVDENKYSIQFDNVHPKDKKIIKNILMGWNETGAGFHKDGSEILIFSRNIENEESLYKSLFAIPFPLVEEKKSGKILSIKTSASRKQKKSLTDPFSGAKVRKPRTCARCGNNGHDTRTCKNDI